MPDGSSVKIPPRRISPHRISHGKILAFFLFLLPLLLEGSPALRTNLNERTASVLYMLDQFHYRKLAMDATTAREWKQNFLSALDSGGLFFLEEDRQALMAIPLDPTRISASRGIPFFEATLLRFRGRLSEVKQLLDRMEKSPVDFAKPETVEFIRNEDVRFTVTAEERAHRWAKLVRHRMLVRAFFRFRQDPTSNTPDKTARSAGDFEKWLLTQEAELRGTVVRRERRQILDLFNHPEGFDNFVAGLFINAIVSLYDPHSVFISSAQRRSLEASLSSRALSYGFTLTRTPVGEIRIDRLVPGGPAWKSFRLNRGDVLTSIRYPDDRDRLVEVADLALEEVNAALNDTRSSRMILTVRKPGGLDVSVSLQKERLSVDENSVTGFILNGRKRVGYIYLPAFYTEWENPNAAVCANDVAKEIIKLKREKIEGLILDLRGNGGGSVSEAVNLAGIFVDSGPICMRSARNDKPVVLKDPSRGTVYDGPLVVLVNGDSASASEFFVAALRDYNRAIIVGSPTFGKASGQVILPVVADRSLLDSAMRRQDEGLDFIKVTTDLYFDLYGQTHQSRGVQPDVLLPDPFYDAERGEGRAPHALPSTALSKTAFFEKGADLPRSRLARKSEKRRDDFQSIIDLSPQIRKALEPEKVSLEPRAFFGLMEERMLAFDAMEKALHRRADGFRVEGSSYNARIETVDAYRRDLSARLAEQIGADVYVNEGYRVTMDLIDALD